MSAAPLPEPTYSELDILGFNLFILMIMHKLSFYLETARKKTGQVGNVFVCMFVSL